MALVVLEAPAACKTGKITVKIGVMKNMKIDACAKIKCVMFTFLCVLIAAAVIITGRKAEAIKEMDSQELHYDADGWLLMVDKEHDLIGIYHAEKPVGHINCDTSGFENGVIDIPALIYVGEETDKSDWWMEGHTKKGE